MSKLSILTEFCIKKLLNENQFIINDIVSNYDPIFKPFIFHLKSKLNYISDKEKESLINELLNNKDIMENIKQDLFIENNRLPIANML